MINLACRYSIVWRLPSRLYRGAQWYDTPADSVTHAELLATAAIEQGADVVEIHQHAPFARVLQTLTPETFEAA